ncbi:MAG: hypothetical protein SGJ09_09405 [Phycisphaerae bacterium]|nr:hypothetical protein [Phycisphaerae bacterium]
MSVRPGALRHDRRQCRAAQDIRMILILTATPLVIFDCDGVLVDSEPLVYRIEAECLKDLGILVSPDEARAAFKGLTTDGVVAAITQRRGGESPLAAWIHDWGFRTAAGLAQELQAVLGEAALPDAPLDRTVVIVDSPSGVRAAPAAGMTCIGFAADEAPQVLRAAGAQHVVLSMQALLESVRT